MSAAVGADIESLCTKCGDVWHVVVAKVGERIAKVQCKQCSALHRYKPPLKPGAAAAVAPPAKAAKVPKVAKAPGASRSRKAHAEPPAPSIAADLGRPVRRYGASEIFTAGDRIQHPSFGLGVVQGSPGPGKINVAFPDGPRVLAQAKAGGPGLGRPTNTFED
jgi:hypothetical protein